MIKYDYAVIGACKAGLSAVETLRERVPAASILLINGEDRLPYKRTHLTKKLASGFSHDEFALKEESWYTDQAIELWNGAQVVEIDSDNHELLCSDGRRASWKKLLIASGAVPFQPDIPGKEFIRHLRSAADTEIIRNSLLKSRRVAVLGQGVEGVEIAEQCRKMGLEVLPTICKVIMLIMSLMNHQFLLVIMDSSVRNPKIKKIAEKKPKIKMMEKDF